jgi:hypothetical protein
MVSTLLYALFLLVEVDYLPCPDDSDKLIRGGHCCCPFSLLLSSLNVIGRQSSCTEVHEQQCQCHQHDVTDQLSTKDRFESHSCQTLSCLAHSLLFLIATSFTHWYRWLKLACRRWNDSSLKVLFDDCGKLPFSQYDYYDWTNTCMDITQLWPTYIWTNLQNAIRELNQQNDKSLLFQILRERI